MPPLLCSVSCWYSVFGDGPVHLSRLACNLSSSLTLQLFNFTLGEIPSIICFTSQTVASSALAGAEVGGMLDVWKNFTSYRGDKEDGGGMCVCVGGGG